MNKHITTLTSKSIEQSGLPKDYKKAIAEFVWNGFDAGATNVSLDFEGNELGLLSSFSISDNGTGIDPKDIDKTFGNFLDSNKRDIFNKNLFQKGHKGKGRFSFSIFANNCKWETKFRESEGKVFAYDIVIENGNLQFFDLDDIKIIKSNVTGTVANFYDCSIISTSYFASKEFRDYLSSEFGWFLFLNRDLDYKILINGVALAYDELIGDSSEKYHKSGKDTFEIVFIRWNQKIGDKYYHYFVGDNGRKAAKKHTSFNNKAIEFHHSAYVKSAFFNDFNETVDDNPVLGFSGPNQSHPSFKSLLKVLGEVIMEKEKHYIRDIQADRLIQDYHDRDVFPQSDTKAKQLENVVKEIYCAEPRIFHSSNTQQSKTLVGLINVLLASGYGENLMEVIESVVDLTDEERDGITGVL